MAERRNTNGRIKGSASGRYSKGDPYTKAAQANRRAHKIVERSLNKASQLAKRGTKTARKG